MQGGKIPFIFFNQSFVQAYTEFFFSPSFSRCRDDTFIHSFHLLPDG